MTSVPTGHALVLGAGIAGLLTAAVLGRRFDHVTLIERDRLPDGPGPRRGVPQGAHVHGLMVQGLRTIDCLLPGLSAEAVASGAVELDFASDLAIHTSAGWGRRFPSQLRTISASRGLLEWTIRRRVAGQSRITIKDRHTATGLVGDGRAVTGASVQDPDGRVTTLPADLVVDATGRLSKAGHWLSALGWPTPREDTSGPHAAYASRIFEAPPGHRTDWWGCFIHFDPPRLQRGGVLAPIESNRWIVTLYGTGRSRPTARDEHFLPFARSLSHPLIADTIAATTPLTPTAGSHATAGRRRRLAGQPDNVILVGDAATCFNPIWAQGMTAAALAARLLAEHLDQSPDLTGFAGRYQKHLSAVTGSCWTSSTAGDAWLARTSPMPTDRAGNWYLDQVLAAGTRDPHVQRELLNVFHLLQPRTTLIRPAVATRVLRAGRTRPATRPTDPPPVERS